MLLQYLTPKTSPLPASFFFFQKLKIFPLSFEDHCRSRLVCEIAHIVATRLVWFLPKRFMSLAQETRTSNNLCYPMSNLLTQCTSVSIIIDLSSSWDNRGVVRAWEELYKSNNTFVFETSANNIYSIAKYILQMLFRLIRYAIQLVFSDQL